MKKILLIVLLIPCILNAQIDKAVNDIAQKKVDSFAATLPILSTKDLKTTAAGTFVFDTLTAPINATKKYFIVLSGVMPSTNDMADAVIAVSIANNNGTYFIRRHTLLQSFSGTGQLVKSNYTLTVNKTGVIMNIVSVAGITNWNTIRTK